MHRCRVLRDRDAARRRQPERKSDPAVDLVLDYVDGHWQMALRRDDACTDSDIKGPSITAWILAPQPDGTLTERPTWR